MSSVYDEITRLKTAKEDIETAIETCGVNVPDTSLISTYASYIRQIPAAIFSDLNVDISGGAGSYIESIEQEDGKIVTTTGGTVSTSKSGLAPQIGTSAAATIGTQADEWVLTSTKGGAPTWRKLPVGAFKTNKTLKFKNTSNTEVSYDGSTAIDLTGGVNYATEAYKIKNHTSSDVNTSYEDLKLKYYTLSGCATTVSTDGKRYAGTSNSFGFPVSNNANSMLWLGAHSGNYGHQLGFSSDGRIYDRYISGGSFVETINGGSWKKIAWTSDIPVTLKNPNAIKFKNISGSEISYDGSAAIDLTSGIHYANIAANISGGAAGSIPYQTAAGTTAFLAKGTSGQVLKMNSSGIPYWTTDNNSNSWRAIQVNGTQIAGTGTGTYAANFISGTGITVTGTAGSSSAANNITITNAGVRSTTINGDYLRVNTNGTNADLTIPFATKAKYLTTSLNTITTTTDDTVAKWSTLGNSVHMYSATGQLNNQPSQFGFILNLAYQNSDVHQIWATQSSGNLYHRGGNHSGGWANISDNNAWRTILDNVNSSVSGDGGSTWGSSITVKINNVSKTLTIPANPNTDTKVAYTAATSNVAHPILFANNSTDSGTPTTGAVYYETNSTNNPGLTYNPYSNTLNTNILNIYNGGHIQINAAIKDHNNPMDQCLCIATPTTSTNLTIKNSPGIGFKVEGKSWASMIFNHAGPCFEFINSNATGHVNIRAAQLISSIGTGYSPLRVTSTTLVSNLNADMLDSYHADDFYKKDDPIDADTLNGFKASDFTRIATINIRHSGSTGILNISGTGIVGGPIDINLGQQISLRNHTINIDGTIQETLLMTLPSGITATVSTSSIVISINRNNLSNNGGTGQIKLLVY